MKKYLVLLLAFAMSLTLVGCGDEEEEIALEKGLQIETTALEEALPDRSELPKGEMAGGQMGGQGR